LITAMSDIVIAAENLSKSYWVGHRSALRESYTALRDVIAREARNFARKTVDLVRGKQIVQGDDVEQFWALRDVSFEVKRGEVLGIIGRNGAGKSTLLKILSRITEPDRGRVTLRGRVASLLEVGTGFHPELTGRENIFLNGAVLGMARAEIKAKFDEIVAFAEVERFLDTPVKRYSSGMYVRLAFSVAAHLEPEILVVDEVLAVGDAEFQRKCLGKMQAVSKGGRTVLFVSHNMAAVRSLCSTVMMLDWGRLSERGPASDVTEAYLRQATKTVAYSLTTADIKRPSNIEPRIRIIGFAINDGAPLLHGAIACFTFMFASDEGFADVAFAVGLCSQDGTRIMSIDSDVPGERITVAKGARGHATLSIDALHLAPATYLLDIGIRSGDTFMLDYLPGVMSITVLPGKLTPAVIAMRSSGHGGVRYPCITIIETKNAIAKESFMKVQ
jgi:lipopolysaccharide transport system ATP-binding protein